ncbi:unnamed protein product [Schistocephalus solidus]|uniref:R3H domain-containing protein n=1 Tax=Schistocephalus solidus TaxID=70667 RepID=A0A183TFJ4_SCHSO|nr:unnamed protein product [Schistocephalus solidus]
MATKTAPRSKRPAMQVYLPPQLRITQECPSSCDHLSEPASVDEDLHIETKDLQEPNSLQEDQHKHPAARVYVPPQLRIAQAQPIYSDGSSDSGQRAPIDSSSKSLKNKRQSKEPTVETESDELAQRLGAVSVSQATSEPAPAPVANEFDNGLLVIESREKAALKVPLGVASSQVLRPEPPLNYGELQHIIELYDFPPTIDSVHLQTELRGFEDSGFVLKWVDDTHCLVVFSSPTEAATALKQISGILLKARPVEEASSSSKWKIAKSPGDWAMPYKRRPPTDSSVASRIISSHLNLPRRKASPAESDAVKAARGNSPRPPPYLPV